MQSDRWQPTRLPQPWDSPGKNTEVGCHFLLQCMKVKSESEVAQLCPTPRDLMDCSPPGPSIYGIFQARVLEWVAISFSNAWKWKVKVKSLSRVWPSATPWTAAFQAPLSRGFPGRGTGVGCCKSKISGVGWQAGHPGESWCCTLSQKVIRLKNSLLLQRRPFMALFAPSADVDRAHFLFSATAK